MVEKRRSFLINSLYVGLLGLITVVIFKFTVSNLMPFVVGFLIAFLLKPIVRKLDDVFGKNKWISIIVTILFYTLVLFLLTWLVFATIAFIQGFIPVAESFVDNALMPKMYELLDWFEGLVQNIDPNLTELVDRGIAELLIAFENILNVASKTALAVVTQLVGSAPKLFVSIILAVISSFLFSIDYEEIIETMFSLMPKSLAKLTFEVKANFNDLIGKYFLAYFKLMSLTFVELSIGFLILRIPSAIPLAALISLVDILPVLGTGTVLLPWALYEFVIGTPTLGIGLAVIYGVITTVRYSLEPRMIGKEIGLHPLVTLISIFLGLRFFGFWGLFLFPIAVTIIVTMHQEKKVNFVGFFNGDVPLTDEPSEDTIIEEVIIVERDENKDEI